MRRRKGTSLRSLRKVDCDAPPKQRGSAPYAESRGGQTMSFHVGQQVVCVDDKFSKREDWRRTVRVFPLLHSIYTIREIVQEGELIGFYFYEITNPRAHFAKGYLEPAFNSRNFRPVRKTSIEIFERLLVPNDLVRAP
jgi:hypothetical protein